MKTPERELIIAADSGSKIGTGHVMRCLALAQGWNRVGEGVTFLIPDGSPAIEQRVRAEGCAVESLRNECFRDTAVNRLVTMPAAIVVLDGYDFGAREQAAVSAAGHQVLTIDDFGHATEYPVRWVLNQNARARAGIYERRRPDTRLLLGPEYALLRKEFLPWLGWRRNVPGRASKILITIGGSDPDNLSLRILESLSYLEDAELEVTLVAGGSNPHLTSLQSALGSAKTRIRLLSDVVDMPTLMAWADVAISGAGGTAYELCYMGLPAFLFVIAENQQGSAEALSKLSVAFNAGWARDFEARSFAEKLRQFIGSQSKRQALSVRARELVDGLGADRVRGALTDRDLQLRLFREDDCQLLFFWANDAAVREASFHSDAISWEEHQRWFSERIRDPDTVIYVAENREHKPIGQVRFQLAAERATLSVCVAPEVRGAGWGKELIMFSVHALERSHAVKRIDAFVKPENRASIHLFESCGFDRKEGAEVAGQAAVLFTWRCESSSHA